MKPAILILCIILAFNANGQDKYFSLTDTVFSVGDIHRIDIYFDFSPARLRPEESVKIDSIVEFLRINPTTVLEIGAHSDYRGNNETNKTLTQKRAECVTNEIIAKGIDPNRIVAKGYGEVMPVVVDSASAVKYPFLPAGAVLSETFIKTLPTVEEQEYAHQLNRRTILKIISK